MKLVSRIKADLKLKIFFTFLLTAIPFLIIAIIFTYYNGIRNIKISIGQRFKEVALQTAEKTSFFIDNEFRKLQNLSGNQKLIDELNTLNEIDVKNVKYPGELTLNLTMLLNQFMTNNLGEYKSIMLTDKRGMVIASTNGVIKDNNRDKEWWKTAYNGIANVSDFYTAEGSYTSTGSVEFFIDIAVPVIDWKGVEFIGVLKGTVSGEWMTKAIVNNWIGYTGHTMLLTDKGTVVICPLEFREGGRDIHKANTATIKNIVQNELGWNIGDNTHSERNAIIGFAPLRLSSDIYKLGKEKWFVIVSQEPAETFAPIYTALWSILLFGLFLTGAFSIIGYYIARMIVKPVSALRKGTELFGSGHRDTRLPVLSEDEIGQLTRSFNKMAASIKERDEEIQKRNREWDNTFNSITDLVAIYNKGYRIVKANKAFARKFNTTPDELIGKKCGEVFTNGMEWGLCSHSRTLETKEAFQEEVYDPVTGGTLMITTSPLFDENKQFIGSVLVAKDITEYKNLQAQLLHTEKLAAVGELASGIAHELNNPLCGIMGFSELLLEREKNEKKKGILAKMLNETQRSQKIIQNLLSFVRANKQEMMHVEVNKIILDTLDLKVREFKNNNIDVIKRLSDPLPKINGNFMQLQQVILNILTNAQMALLDFKKEKKEIIIETRLKTDNDESPGERSTVEILIKDNGSGIVPEHLSKIFNPFFTTKEAGKGTGLGLSISYGIIKEHNGRIYAESKIGEGAVFHIELPVRGL